MIAVSPEASAQIAALELFYVEKGRSQALRNLAHALAEASLIITNAPESGSAAPLPYPELAAFGLSWLKRGRCWIAFAVAGPDGPRIAGVFFESDDIPNRMR